LITATLALAAPSNAGTYTFIDCTNWNLSHIYPWPNVWTGEVEYVANPSTSAFTFGNEECDQNMYVKSNARSYSYGHNAVMRYSLPGSSTFTSLGRMFYYFNTAGGFYGEIQFNSADGSNQLLIKNETSPGVTPGNGDFTSGAVTVPPGRDVFRALLLCNAATCTNHNAVTAMSDILLTINDPAPPLAGIAGTITNPGTVSGTRTLQAIGLDLDSGVRLVSATVNGTNVLWHYNPSCATNQSRLGPCSSPFSPTIMVDTTKPPWKNGANTVSVCARDYADLSSTPNIGCTPSRTVTVSN